MNNIPSSILAPLRLCSPGLERILERLSIASAETIVQLKLYASNQQILCLLAAQGLIDQQKALQQIAAEIGVNLVTYEKLEQNWLEHAVFYQKITCNFALTHRCFPFQESDGKISVAMSDPLDLETLKELEFLLPSRVAVSLASEQDIVKAITNLLEPHLQEGRNDAAVVVSGEDENLSVGSSAEKENQLLNTAPVVSLVNKILADAIGLNASDIHFEPTAKSIEVRFRIDGVMSAPYRMPENLKSYVAARIKLLAKMDITEKRRPQDGSFSIRVGSHETRNLRASSVPTPQGEKLVLRLLRSESEGIELDSISLPVAVVEAFKAILHIPDRLIVVTGPTGSGKSTTLYAALNFLRDGTRNIITIEDPIEFRLPGITQIQVDRKINMTFASAMRSVLRQDPDVILIGEIRDKETAEIAFQAAQTGHLVLSTLHTNSAVAAVTRLLDLGLEPFVIASSLGGIMAQRLVRKLCDFCKRPISENEKLKILFEGKIEKVCQAEGCEKCSNTGYRGRVGVFSFIAADAHVRELIRQGASEEVIELYSKQSGLEDLPGAGLKLVKAGITSLDEVERVIGQINKKSVTQTKSSSVSEFNINPPIQSQIRDETRSAGSSSSIADLAEKYLTKELKGQPKVLLVDDDEGIRMVLARLLQRNDFEVIDAKSGKEALSKLTKFIPDVIVCDLMMPGINGKDLLQRIRENQTTTNVPVLMLTGSDAEVNEIALIEAGANDFVSKSSSPAVVVARVKRLLS